MSRGNTKVISVIGPAGSGKSTVTQEVSKNKPLYKISFSDALKEMVSRSLPTELIKEFNHLGDRREILEYLKDNRPDIKLVGDFSAREVLQCVGTEIMRCGMSDDIHIVLSLSNLLKELKSLNKEDDLVIVSDDTRFENELRTMAGLYGPFEEERGNGILIIEDYLKRADISFFNSQESKKILENTFKVKVEDSLFLQNLNKELMEGVEIVNLKNFLSIGVGDKKIKENPLLDNNNLGNIPKLKTPEQLYREAGIIKIFRSLIDKNKIEELEKKMHDPLQSQEILKKSIMEFTGLTKKEVNAIAEIYEKTVGFTLRNVIDFGYIRADPRHPSECGLKNVQFNSSAIINNDEGLEEFQKKISNLLISNDVNEILSMTSKNKKHSKNKLS